ncbi:MAG: membrane protein insertion efficiency factor YidD [Flammeovirgaceae bacterium]
MSLQLIFLLVTLSLGSAYAQYVKTDFALLKEKDAEDKVEVVQSGKKHKLNPINWVYHGSIGLYQKHISAQLGANCIYEVTCSRFSRKLVEEFGVIKGSLLSLDRVGRCNKLYYMESSPVRLNKAGKIIETVQDYHLH